MIGEIHRRSLWQVLVIYLIGSWIVLEAVELLTDKVGLPSWTPSMAAVLLLAFLPVALAAAYAREPVPGEHPLAAFVHEIHRRSLWQVLGIFLAASWGVLQVVEVLTETLGLPDWAPTMALVLLLVGLPICMATAFVQEGLPGRERRDDGVSSLEPEGAPSDTSLLAPGAGTVRLLTWRNALLGGVGAFALLGFSLVTYFVMWTTGIGPVGNLVAQGVFVAGERVLLADFADATGEEYGAAITEALRVDLLAASTFELIDAASIAPTLRLMQLEPGTPLTSERALQVAAREGIPAVLDGEVSALGTGYILRATLRAADDGHTLAAFRVTADGPDDLIRSTDRLSQDIRAKSGEQLRTIRAGKPLEQVTTSSLEALKLYSEATRVFGEQQDGPRAAELLERALAQDSTFAMAWRMLGIALQGGVDPARRVDAIASAFRHRERLPDVERYVIEALYHSNVVRDHRRAIEAYENTLRVDSLDPRALNNGALLYHVRDDLERAEAMLRRGVASRRATNGVLLMNLVDNRVFTGRTDEATAFLLDWEETFPDDLRLVDWQFTVSFAEGDVTGAADHARGRSEDRAQRPDRRAAGASNLGRVAFWEGRLGEARSDFLRAEALGAQAGPSIGWSFGVETAYEEALVGDPEWARTHMREWLDGPYRSLAAAGREQLGNAETLAVSGDTEAVRFLLEDWERVTPAHRIGPTDRAIFERAALYARVAQGDTVDARPTMERLLLEWGCFDTCWLFERARFYDRLGDRQEAVRHYERVLEPGYHGWGANTGERLAAMLRLGPLYEEIGDTAGAVGAYQRMVDQWADADARGQETVHRFRERIARLGGRAGA